MAPEAVSTPCSLQSLHHRGMGSRNFQLMDYRVYFMQLMDLQAVRLLTASA